MAVQPPSGTVTFLCTDIEASARLWESAPADMAIAVHAHDVIVRSAIYQHSGFVFDTARDGFRAAFSSAVDAVLAAIDSQRELAADDAVAFTVRMGLHVGEALAVLATGVRRTSRVAVAAVAVAATLTLLPLTRTTPFASDAGRVAPAPVVHAGPAGSALSARAGLTLSTSQPPGPGRRAQRPPGLVARAAASRSRTVLDSPVTAVGPLRHDGATVREERPDESLQASLLRCLQSPQLGPDRIGCPE